MRRNSRIKNSDGKNLSDKIIMYSVIGVGILTVILVALLIYSKNLSDDVKNETMSLEQMANIASNSSESHDEIFNDIESVSTEIGKTLEESQNEIGENNTSGSMNVTSNSNMTNNTNNTNNVNNSNNTNSANSALTTKNITNSTQANSNTSKANTENKTEEKKQETKKELKFQKPIEGEMVREYAKDNLIYSNTLEEWVTHLGIDIKADKTTVVNAAEAGTIKSIKNDPRYGLTIVIEHDDEFQTVYSNLLTSEFVVEGEKVEKGQAIGTVGNTAVFEITDDPHLHFEILKNSVQEDPSIYIK